MKVMRRASWLATLGILVTCGCSAAPPPPPYRPVADVKQLMASVVEPAADVYWDAVGSIVDATGVHEFEPQSVEEWDAVRNSAYVVSESGNLLMMPSRAKDGGEWMQLAQAMIESGQKAIRAAESRNKTAVFDAGAEVYDTCTNCHAKYALDLQRPNAQ
jgi:hypothetical protein